MKRKLAIALSAAMMAATFSVPAAAAQSNNGGYLNYLNVQIMPVDDNYAATDFIQATFTPDNGEEAVRAQSCSGKTAATNFMSVPSGTVTFNKAGYRTEPASWHVDANNFDNQTLEFTLIPDNYSGDLRAAAMPEASLDDTDRDENGNPINSRKRLVLSTSTPGAAIRYTTDGSEPGYESSRYSGPIILEKDTTFKAIATKGGYVKSPVMEYQYKAPAQAPRLKTPMISGAIVDEAGTPIPDVSVNYTYTHGSNGTGTTISASAEGQFTIFEYEYNTGTLTFSKEGYTFESVDVTEDYDGSVLSITGRSAAVVEETAPETETPETEQAGNTVTLYFMTGSNPSQPGEVFAQFEVAKNSRGNTTTIAKTVGSAKPEKEGYRFSHWKEAKLNDASLLGNRVGGVIWTNETDQYIYAQYEEEIRINEGSQTELGGVILYQNGNYGGKSLTLKEGRYKMGQLSQVGNDAVSSLKVPEGYKVTLYADNNFKGRTLICESDISWLGDHRFNDITSSVVVEKK